MVGFTQKSEITSVIDDGLKGPMEWKMKTCIQSPTDRLKQLRRC